MGEIHHTKVEDATIDESGWVQLSDDIEVTALPVIDLAHRVPGTAWPLFARLNYDEALEVGKRNGARLIAPSEVEQLRRVGLQLMPFLGTPRAENGIEHSEAHDRNIWEQLRARGWDGKTPVCGAGKCWVDGAPPGRSRLMGWDKDGPGPGLAWWQPDSVAHNRAHFDDGTTTMLVRPRSRGVVRDLWSALSGFGSKVFGAAATAASSNVVATQVSPARQEVFMGEIGAIPFVQAKHFRAGRTAAVRLVVIHDMEAAETTKTAENVAAWFKAGQVVSSAHFCVDSDSIVQCVKEGDTAFAAPGANHDGIHVELAGYAKQSAADWDDAYSRAMLVRAAELVASICERHGLPVRFVNASGLVGGECGITTHAEVSRAFKKSTHTDPGPNFPMERFLALASGEA